MPRLSNPDNIATSPDGKEPSSPSIDNDEEVELLGVVMSPADALTPAVKSGTQDLLSTPAANTTTHTFGKEETEVTYVFSFFNPQALKKPRCNTLRDCFNITPNGLEGVIVTCKNCTKFGVRKRNAFNATYAREHALKCHGVAIEVRALLLSDSQAGKINKKVSMLTPPTNSTLASRTVWIVSSMETRTSLIAFLGAGSAKEIADVIDCCFNMDGAKPSGSKVGLIDEYHIWCFLMDPFSYE
jgi:hypothetical protein